MNTIDKIRAEIERRLKDYWKICFHDVKAYNEDSNVRELKELLSFLDTLEAETSYNIQQYTPSPSVDIGDVARVQFASHAKVFDKKRKAVFDWEQFKEVVGIFYGFGKKDSQEIKESEQPTMGYDEAYLNEKIARASKTWEGVDVDEYMDEVRGREPVNEDLEEAARQYERSRPFAPDESEPESTRKTFKAGAEWQKKQFEKNRLAACDNHTKEEYDRETDFAMRIIEKEYRTPTFSDAINYGIEWQKAKMMEGAVEGFIFQSADYYPKQLIAGYDGELGMGDKVRIIILPKEDEK